MAYPNYYYPVGYQPYQMQPAPQQPQTAGFIRVPSEDVARNWNVLPGTSATFINENAPYCYTKTVGASQLDGSRFEKYRLVKEDDEPQNQVETKQVEYVLKSEFDSLKKRFDELEKALGGVKNEPVND